jgi:cytochrome c oxidase cbb3-type subunit 3
MISWENQLSPLEMQQVSSFIFSLRGTNPPNQKAPEGELYKPE